MFYTNGRSTGSLNVSLRWYFCNEVLCSAFRLHFTFKMVLYVLISILLDFLIYNIIHHTSRAFYCSTVNIDKADFTTAERDRYHPMLKTLVNYSSKRIPLANPRKFVSSWNSDISLVYWLSSGNVNLKYSSKSSRHLRISEWLHATCSSPDKLYNNWLSKANFFWMSLAACTPNSVFRQNPWPC